jgi:hypothetical protein
MLQHNIWHAVRDMLRFSSGAWTTTWKAVLHTMKYCVEMKNHGLVFAPERMWTGKDFEYDLIGYSDSNYATDYNSRQSIMSCQVYMGGCCVLAKSKQMAFVTLSITETDLVAAVEYAQDLMYSKVVMEGMGLRVQLPMPIYVDNKAVVNMIRNHISGGPDTLL